MPILNLRIDQGTTFSTDLTINTDATTALDLTGYTLRGEMRRHHRSSSVTQAFTTIVKTGVSKITVTAGGSGYTGTPTVTITSTGGDTPNPAATATAVVVSGIVTSVIVNTTGVGYFNVPTIGFTGGGGSNAAATATTETQDGKINISLTDVQTSAIKAQRYVYDLETVLSTTIASVVPGSTSINFSSGTGPLGEDQITTTGGTWDTAIKLGTFLTVSSAEDATNNITFTVKQRVSATILTLILSDNVTVNTDDTAATFAAVNRTIDRVIEGVVDVTPEITR